MAADWLHCNACYLQPSGGGVKFYLASCGHCFCQTCIDGGACRSTCKVCNQPAHLMEINRQMKPEMQQFFLDPKDFQKKQQKQLQQILDFQAEQRGRITKFYRSQLKRATTMFSAYQADMKKKADLEKNFKLLRDEFRKSKEEVHFLRAQAKNNQLGASTPKAMQYRHRSVPNTNGSPNVSNNPLINSFNSSNNSATTPRHGVSPSRLSLRIGGSGGSQGSPQQSPAPSEMTTPKMLGYSNPSTSTSRQFDYNASWNPEGGHAIRGPVTPTSSRKRASPAMKLPFNASR